MNSPTKNDSSTAINEMARDESRYDLRFVFSSLFANIIRERRKSGVKLSELASEIGVNKSQLTNWLSNEPNWQISTIADIARGLRLKLVVHAVDEEGACWSPIGRTEKVSVGNLITPPQEHTVQMHIVRITHSNPTKPQQPSNHYYAASKGIASPQTIRSYQMPIIAEFA